MAIRVCAWCGNRFSGGGARLDFVDGTESVICCSISCRNAYENQWQEQKAQKRAAKEQVESQQKAVAEQREDLEKDHFRPVIEARVGHTLKLDDIVLNPWSHEYVTKEELVVDKVRHGHGGLLSSVPEKLKTAELCLAAVKSYGNSIDSVPKELRTAEICLTAIQNGGGLSYVPEHLRTAEICRIAIQKSSVGYGLHDVPEHLRTAELCLAAVNKQFSASLSDVPEKLRTAEICRTLVQKDGMALQYVPENLKTVELCLIAVQQNKYADSYVPAALQARVKKELERSPAPRASASPSKAAPQKAAAGAAAQSASKRKRFPVRYGLLAAGFALLALTIFFDFTDIPGFHLFEQTVNNIPGIDVIGETLSDITEFDFPGTGNDLVATIACAIIAIGCIGALFFADYVALLITGAALLAMTFFFEFEFYLAVYIAGTALAVGAVIAIYRRNKRKKLGR